MKKLLALLVAASFFAGCSSDNQPVNSTPTLVVVKHKDASGTHKHHKKHASTPASKMGS
jgi:uncharacterized lipoprotein YajG